MPYLALCFFLAVAQTPYRATFVAQHTEEGVVFSIKVFDRASSKVILASTLTSIASIPAETEATVDGVLLRVSAVARSDGRAEVTLDVVKNGTTIEHSLVVGRVIEEGKFTGDPISLNLRNADIKDVLHSFAELTGISMAIDPEVRGTVTIELVDVPWDQALDLILHQNRLISKYEDGILRVMPR
jgi:type II secretory pathway component HofQ